MITILSLIAIYFLGTWLFLYVWYRNTPKGLRGRTFMPTKEELQEEEADLKYVEYACRMPGLAESRVKVSGDGSDSFTSEIAEYVEDESGSITRDRP